MASTAVKTAQYLLKHTDELATLVRSNDSFIQACESLNIRDRNALLPLKRTSETRSEPVRDLCDIQKHETWRTCVLEAILSEQIRSVDIDDDSFRVEDAEETVVETELRAEREAFNASTEAQWKAFYKKHREQVMSARFPSRKSYAKAKARLKLNRDRGTGFLPGEETREQRLARIRENFQAKSEAMRNKAEWREWEAMQNRWTLTAKINKKNRRVDQFLEKKRQSDIRKKENLREEATKRRQRRKEQRTPNIVLERKINKKLCDADERRRQVKYEAQLRVVKQRCREDQRAVAALRHRRMLDWRRKDEAKQPVRTRTKKKE